MGHCALDCPLKLLALLEGFPEAHATLPLAPVRLPLFRFAVHSSVLCAMFGPQVEHQNLTSALKFSLLSQNEHSGWGHQ